LLHQPCRCRVLVPFSEPACVRCCREVSYLYPYSHFFFFCQNSDPVCKKLFWVDLPVPPLICRLSTVGSCALISDVWALSYKL
jgi:hypothetical protein